MKKIALVDADMLCYMAGFAVQKTNYAAVWEDHSGNIHEEIFPSKASMKEWQLEHPEQKLFDEEKLMVVEPVEHALSIVKNKMQEMRQFGMLEVYIKGDGTNWRDKIATLHGYKANRTAPSPVWLPFIREYLIDHWGAIKINGKEVDDQVATRAAELSGNPNVTICHADKDLDQIPGRHFNYSQNVEYFMEPIECLAFFYKQILMGDYSDNVHGCWKCGAKQADIIVSEAIAFAELNDLDVEKVLWHEVVTAYEASQAIVGCPYVGMPSELVALENARLVWMQNEPGRLWTPPGWEPEYLETTLDD